jgi:hypothetical protein
MTSDSTSKLAGASASKANPAPPNANEAAENKPVVPSCKIEASDDAQPMSVVTRADAATAAGDPPSPSAAPDGDAAGAGAASRKRKKVPPALPPSLSFSAFSFDQPTIAVSSPSPSLSPSDSLSFALALKRKRSRLSRRRRLFIRPPPHRARPLPHPPSPFPAPSPAWARYSGYRLRALCRSSRRWGRAYGRGRTPAVAAARARRREGGTERGGGDRDGSGEHAPRRTLSGRKRRTPKLERGVLMRERGS